MFLKRIAALGLALTMGLSLAACSGGSSDSGSSDDKSSGSDSAAQGDTIVIGGIAPLTGNVSSYGVAAMNGASLYFEERNAAGGVLGKQLEFVIEDEKGDPTEATYAYNSLKDKAVAILGDVTSGPTAAVAKLSAEDNMPMMTPTATAAAVTTFGTNTYRACFLDPFQSETIVKFISEDLGTKSAAIIFNSDDDYSVGLKDAFVTAAEAGGIQIVATESYATDDKEFRSQLGNILTANPEVVFVPDYYNNVVLIAAQAREIGLGVPLLGADGWDSVLETTTNKSDLEGCYFTSHYSTNDPDEKIQNFVKNYTETYNTVPNSFAALGYDAAMMLCEAIENAGNTDKQAVIDAMSALNVTGVTGPISYPENGDPQKQASIIEIKDGEYTLVKKLS